MYSVYPESAYQLCNPDEIRKYIRGGKGVVTLESPSGKHHTYAFSYPRMASKFPDGTMFIYAQVSSGAWLYCGMLQHDYKFRLTRFSEWGEECEIVKGARYIVNMMCKDLSNCPMKLYHAGVCSVCGRKLTKPSSIRIGIGPSCRKKLTHGS